MDETKINKIMLVEDEDDIRIVAKYSLEKIGHFTVKYCTSGKEAIESAVAFSPDLILLDSMMPEMDGIMTFKALRELPTIKNVPIIFMTAKVQNHEIDQYMSIGAIGVIAKPFDPTELPDLINKIWIEHRRKNNG